MQILVGTEAGLRVVGDGSVREDGLGDGGPVTTLAPAGEGHLCVTDGRVVHWGRPGDWQPVVTVPEGTRIVSVLASPTAGLLVGAAEARVWQAPDWEPGGPEVPPGGLVPSAGFDALDKARWWNAPVLGPQANVRSLAQGPDGTLYANVHVGGLLRSSDLGATWEPTIDLDVDVHEVRVAPDGRVLLATGLGGCCVSDDRGDTWTSVVEGLPVSMGVEGQAYARAVQVIDATVLLTASSGAFYGERGDGGVFRRPLDADADAPFERCRDGLPDRFPTNINTGCLTVGDGLAAFGSAEGEVYVTGDAGARWSRAATGLPAIACVSA
jgi:hypothetical protein